MIIEKVSSVEQFEGLRSEWNDLLKATPSNSVFLTHEWLFTWWKHLNESRTLSILAARDSGRLVGIAPLTVRPPQYSRMFPELLEFLGSGVIGSDYLDVFIDPGSERAVLEAFADYIENENLMLQLSQVRRGNSAVLGLANLLERKEWTIVDTRINRCPFIDLSGQNWESYLASLGSSQRYNVNRRLKNLEKSFNLRLDCVQSPGESLEALETLVQLHRKRWEPMGGASEAFQTDAILAFHREFVELAAGRGWLRILVLRLNNEPAAALYGLRYDDTFYFYQSGYDPAYDKQSVGLAMMALAIRHAIEEGAGEYDLLHGEEEYKFHWARSARELGRLELYPARTLGTIYRHAIDLNRAARRMARRVLVRS